MEDARWKRRQGLRDRKDGDSSTAKGKEKKKSAMRLLLAAGGGGLNKV